MAQPTGFSPIANDSLELSGIDSVSPDHSGLAKALLGPPKGTSYALPAILAEGVDGVGPGDSIPQAGRDDASDYSTGVIEEGGAKG